MRKPRRAQQPPFGRELPVGPIGESPPHIGHNEAVRIFDTTIIDPWLDIVWQARGTDLHCTAGAPPVARVDGDLRAIEGAAILTTDDIERIVNTLIGADGYARFERERQYDFSFDWGAKARVRANAFFERGTVALRSGSSPTRSRPRRARPSTDLQPAGRVAAGPRDRHRSDRRGQDHHARSGDRQHQLAPCRGRDHGRGAHRVPPPPQALVG